MPARIRQLRALVLLLALASVAWSCGQAEEQVASEAAPEPAGPADLMPNGAEPLPGVWVGGQPSPEQLAAASEAGVRTVINLRGPDEKGTEGEKERVESLGMTYVSIPIEGADDLGPETALRLSEALDDATRPVVVHCRSGARVGGLFAARAFYVEGKSVDESLAVGRAAGMARYEDKVRERLESEAAADEQSQGATLDAASAPAPDSAAPRSPRAPGSRRVRLTR